MSEPAPQELPPCWSHPERDCPGVCQYVLPANQCLHDLLLQSEERLRLRAAAAYFDASFPERACDYCGRPYRGPALYCCLVHAVADA